jgi:hypothetical protein
MPQVTASEEAKALALLSESIAALAGAINSLGGTQADAKARYLFWTASFVNHTAAGFLKLKELNLKASKLLVRPCLEALFNVCATINRGDFLFEKACAEWREENKYTPKDPASRQAAEDVLNQLKAFFGSSRSNDDIRKDRLHVSEVAGHAGLATVYNSAYRVYCQYTHGALRAAVGDLDEVTDSRDTPYVAYMVLKLLRLLVEHCGAVCPDLDALEKLLCTHFDVGAVEND